MILKLFPSENRRSLLKKRVDTLVVAVAEAAWTESLFRLMNSLTHYFFLPLSYLKRVVQAATEAMTAKRSAVRAAARVCRMRRT